MKVLGISVAIIGILAALFVGGYLMFIGGIIQFVDGIEADPNSGSDIAWGITRFLFSGLVGWIIAFCGIGLGAAIVDAELD